VFACPRAIGKSHQGNLGHLKTGNKNPPENLCRKTLNPFSLDRKSVVSDYLEQQCQDSNI
jgi:hypothetical protein